MTALVAVVGPTATGKSELAVHLALALDGEVVNADAMQLYRGMDVGTAKLSAADRRGVPHHLLDVLNVRAEASVAAYQRAARAALSDISARGKTAILVGGSGLYVRAALDRLEIPPTDVVVRRRLESELLHVGPQVMHARLRAVDPAAAGRIEPANGRRIVRALEVVEITGRAFSASLPQEEYVRPAVQLGLHLPRELLDRRIDDRVEQMRNDGLAAEVTQLVEHGLRQARTASRALGYAQVLQALDGECTMDEAIRETARCTRKFARRQQSWFGRDPRVRWLAADQPQLLQRALGALLPGSRPQG